MRKVAQIRYQQTKLSKFLIRMGCDFVGQQIFFKPDRFNIDRESFEQLLDEVHFPEVEYRTDVKPLLEEGTYSVSELWPVYVAQSSYSVGTFSWSAKIIRLFQSYGIDIQLRIPSDAGWENPLELAVKWDNSYLTRSLLKCGARTDVMSENGSTLLDLMLGTEQEGVGKGIEATLPEIIENGAPFWLSMSENDKRELIDSHRDFIQENQADDNHGYDNVCVEKMCIQVLEACAHLHAQ